MVGGTGRGFVYKAPRAIFAYLRSSQFWESGWGVFSSLRIRFKNLRIWEWFFLMRENFYLIREKFFSHVQLWEHYFASLIIWKWDFSLVRKLLSLVRITLSYVRTREVAILIYKNAFSFPHICEKHYIILILEREK